MSSKKQPGISVPTWVKCKPQDQCALPGLGIVNMAIGPTPKSSSDFRDWRGVDRKNSSKMSPLLLLGKQVPEGWSPLRIHTPKSLSEQAILLLDKV